MSKITGYWDDPDSEGSFTFEVAKGALTLDQADALFKQYKERIRKEVAEECARIVEKIAIGNLGEAVANKIRQKFNTKGD